MTTTYNGYDIHSTCDKTPLFYISRDGKDLFYGIKSREEAKQTVDNWITAVKVLG